MWWDAISGGVEGRLAAVVAAALGLACGSSGGGDDAGDDSGQSTTDPSGSGDPTGDGDGDEVGDGDGDGDEGDDEGDEPKFDTVMPGDWADEPPWPGQCNDEMPPEGTTGGDMEPDWGCVDDLPEGEPRYECVPAPASGDCEDYTDECVLAAIADEAGACNEWPGSICDYVGQFDGACCYQVIWYEGQVCPGRPFVVDGDARLSDTLRRGDWCEALAPDLRGLSSKAREVLAAAWLEDARHEHASVASFSRFCLQLLALGAPPEFVEGAQRAIADELAHAKLAFGFASAYGGQTWGPGPLEVGGALQGASDPALVAAATAAEGCIAETISAQQLMLAAARTKDPVVKASLERIAAEELEHVALAWSALGWMLRSFGPRVRGAVAAVFDEAPRHIPEHPSADAAGLEVLAAHGRLSDAEREHVAKRCLEQIVAPAWLGLCAQLDGRRSVEARA